MKKIFKFYFFPVILLVFFSCNHTQAVIDRASKTIQYAEQNKEDLTQADFDKIELQMEELQKDLEINRKDYTDQQVKEIRKLQGRYAALLVKKGINDFKEAVKDLSNQVEGFVEGITDTLNNKNN